MTSQGLETSFSRLSMDPASLYGAIPTRKQQNPVIIQRRPPNTKLPRPGQSPASSQTSNGSNKIPAVPRSHPVNEFIKEPSYSTIILQPVQNQPASQRGARTTSAASLKLDQPVNVQVEPPIYANITGFEQDPARQLQQQQQLYYASPPSPVSSSYSELCQATRLPLGYHIQQHMKQQQQLQQHVPTYDSLYEPVQQPHGTTVTGVASNSSLYAISGDLYQGLGSNSSSSSGGDSFGKCFKCLHHITGEGSGCEAMGRRYHVRCFTCHVCACALQGQPFYALDGKPYCSRDYLNTLEKCCKCMEPIRERILRATGKPYHPQCFACVVCRKSLDGVPFTVDAANQIHCIPCFHRCFAPKCSVCHEPIMPTSSREEAVRVVALDRSFHLECYRCEDCNLLLSSKDEDGGNNCYPLDDHVLCKNCNTRRIQALTSSIM